MKFVVLACLATVAAAAPQFARPYAIVRDYRQDLGGGLFNYEFETENGIYVGASGRPGSRGQSNMEGYYRFPFPEGGFGEVRYVADENGFRAQYPLIPGRSAYRPYNNLDQIRYADRLRRLGFRQG